MPVRLLDLRHVPDDEADDVRRLLDANGIDWYETPPGLFGISAGGVWIRDGGDVAQARRLLDGYQAERRRRARAERERELREANENLAAQAEMLAARSETLEAARKTAIKAHQDAEYANRAKSQFLAHMSHELRTPLNAIIGFSEIMAMHLLGPSGVPQYDRYAEDILAAGRHLLSVIDDILDLSKVEAGKMKLVCDHVPWSRLASDCLTLLRPMAADRMIVLQAEPAPEGAALYADERLAKQMLVNLLSNAVKYTPSGGQAALRLRPQSDGSAVVEVADTGVGMGPEDVEKALEPFGRIDSALVSQMRGTGLGLPLVKALIELHGGRLEIDSEVGKGTVVRLYFPSPPAVTGAN